MKNYEILLYWGAQLKGNFLLPSKDGLQINFMCLLGNLLELKTILKHEPMLVNIFVTVKCTDSFLSLHKYFKFYGDAEGK